MTLLEKLDEVIRNKTLKEPFTSRDLTEAGFTKSEVNNISNHDIKNTRSKNKNLKVLFSEEIDGIKHYQKLPRLLFCNIGWMKEYRGQTYDDKIERGGAYNQTDIGHEVCNFTDVDSIVYGYVQPSGGVINIQNIGGGAYCSKSDSSIDDVMVIWTAGPPKGGTAIIGWYKNATVFRDFQKFAKTPKQFQPHIKGYWIKAAFDDATLLLPAERNFKIPRSVKGGIGQSNVWFADKSTNVALVKKVLAMIEGHLPDVESLDSALEGNPRLVTHIRRERNIKLVKIKKAQVLESTGKLCCEACGFDFYRTYGKNGEGFCEVHHINPLGQENSTVETKLDDLAILCSNCHRIIHRSNPMISISRVSELIKEHCNDEKL